MKYIFLILFFYFLLLTSYSQDYHKIDSLKQILKTLPELNGTDADTSRMKLCIDIGDLYENSNPDSAIWWYCSIADTVFNAEKIIIYPKRSKKNAIALRYIGIVSKNRGNYSQAILFYEKSLKIAEKIEDMQLTSSCLLNLGNLSKNQSDFTKAIDYYEKSLEIAEDINDKILISTCLINLGNIELHQCDYPKAIEYYEKSLKIKEELDDKQGVANCLGNMGAVSIEQGNYQKAIEYIEKALKIAEEYEDKKGISFCLGNMGIVSMFQGDYLKAIEYFEKSMKLREKLEDKKGISFCLMNLGNVSSDQSNYPKAIEYYEKSLKIAEELKDKLGISNCITSMGTVSLDQGDYSKAFEYYEKSLKIFEELEYKKGISDCLNNMGIISMYQGNFPKAIEYHEKSLSLKEELQDKKGISSCNTNLGIISKSQGHYPEAIEYYEKSLKISEELKDKPGISACLTNLGNISTILGDYPKAIEYYQKSIIIAEELGLKDNLVSDYSSIAKACVHLQMTEKAKPLFLKSQEITLSLLKENFTILSEKEKELYIDKTKNIFNDLHSFNINFQPQNDNLSGICYNNELILKGLLLKSTKIILDVVSNSSDTIMKNSYFYFKQLRNQISEMQVSEINNRDSVIAELEKQANEEERKLVRLSSDFADIQNLFNYRWEDVQKALKEGEAAIEFVQFTKGINLDTTVYSALLITSECKYPLSIKLFEENELENIFSKTDETGYNFINSLYGENNKALYELVWKSLDTYLSGIRTIYYAPVGVLNKISFAALSKESGIMLCDKYNLQQVTTTGKLINNDNESEFKLTASVFGDINYNSETVNSETGSYQGWNYLPGTLLEIEKIEKQFKKNKIAFTTYSGKEAKEDQLKKLYAENCPHPGVLHISTHGFFYPDPKTKAGKREQNEDQNEEVKFRGSDGFGYWMFVNNKNPMMRSGLVFAGANNVWSEDWGRTDNEGVLTAYEVSNMNMRNTDLVVLSACETGLGDIKGSEGVYGLQRAFKMAGVKYIMMSLWRVPDKETVVFMEMFYKKLLKIKDVRTAFNETQKEMRKKYDPYYWAAFVLVE